ncbi:MAG: SDR family NAD(P)-dependent oxidoreductase, partial [Alphaproteobacteria bacterium]|nr:SDR family NAD(P)-dependent oxidoreductase [Alphaproteobacteria bacterium]
MNPFDLTGRVALVTGANTGIGQGIAVALAEAGADVALAGRSSAEETAGLVRAAGRRAALIAADLSTIAPVGDVVESTLAELGGLDILVNNAGLAVTGPLEDYRAEDFDRQFGLNVRAVFLAVQAAARVMRDGGRIITIGSIIADLTLGPGSALYASSKSALGGLTRGLARDLGPRGITVNLVQP